MKILRSVTALAIALAASTVAAQGTQPGELVAGFGDGDGYKRIDFNDISGGVFDSARALVLIKSPLGVLQKILVAGPAGGRRVGIVQLNANGSADTAFGNGGRALSTRTNVARFAGMVRMPNGDIVIGYSDDYTGQNDSKDFFIEVFTAQGQPRNIGGPEVGNQQYADLSTDAMALSGRCDQAYLQAEARAVALTGEGNIVVTGSQSTDDGARVFAFAEFQPSTYGPARAAWGFQPQCRSTGAASLYSSFGEGARLASLASVNDIVANAGNSVHLAGAGVEFGGTETIGAQAHYRLGVDSGNDSSAVPSGFWANANSSLNRMRIDAIDAGRLLLFGERENGTFGSGIRLSPLVGRSQGTTLTPFFFLPEGQAAGTTMTLGDGERLAGSEQFWVLGSATACSVGNNCPRSWDSWTVGVSTGATLFNTYLPDTRFGTNGWVRNNVPNYDATPTGGSFGWRAELVRPTSSLLPSDLYVVGEFAYNGAINDYDWFVAKLRLFNSEAVQPVDAIFRDGYE
jgi:hypothetical protein